MNKEAIEKTLRKLAIELATEFNYTKGKEDKRRSKSKFGFDDFNIDKNLFYVQYGTTNITNNKKCGGNIRIRYRFESPRIDVYLPDCKGFASLEFSNFNKENGKYGKKWHYSESQIFGVEGIELFNKIYNRFFEILKEVK